MFNAGFLAFTQKVPDQNSTKFNFTAEFGAGFECYVRDRRSLAFDVRYHHTSNGFRGEDDLGIDNLTFRMAYSLSHSKR
jgi:hypothetical protein